MVIDDLSVRISKLIITEFARDAGGSDLTWDSVPDKTYTVQFGSTLGRHVWRRSQRAWLRAASRRRIRTRPFMLATPVSIASSRSNGSGESCFPARKLLAGVR